ncbi:DNA-protecting protein DprA [Tatumella saanichensis]|uniref:DNA-protecting protein DprA n=1 Tax=Tatumella saanichensis TaxID=480813 RepID=UPI0004A257BE|nr:DNA-protecting protein DprA [Tatumella saanichensis]
MDRIETVVRLAAVQGIRAVRRAEIAGKLTEHSPTEAGVLRALGLNSLQCQQFSRVSPQQISFTRQWLEGDKRYLITLGDEYYPLQLAEAGTCPFSLFIEGDPSLLSLPQLAVVGSRQSTRYGEHWGEVFASALAVSGLVITSGLAYGIDAVAHRAALACGGRTLAVLGSGLHHLYPSRHRSLAREIIDSGGTVISEFPLNAPPRAAHFPRRNRIISGLSLGVLVVEATLKSGSLITARYALEQNRNIYALPGPLGKAESEGSHWLIKQGALLVSHPNDLLEDLNTGYHSLRFSVIDRINSSQEDRVSLPFADVLANVEDEVTPVDVVAERAGQPVPEIAAALLELELAGWIAAVPGGYVRLRRACHVRRTYVLV